MYLNTRTSMSHFLCDESIRLLSQADSLHNESVLPSEIQTTL